MPFTFEQDFAIARPPSEVFAYLTDPGRLAEWQPNLREIEADPPAPLAPGTRLREVRSGPFGRKVEARVEVAECAPPSVFALHVTDGAPVDGRWTLSPDGDNTRLQFTCESGLPRLARPAIRRVFKQAHARLKDRLEA